MGVDMADAIFPVSRDLMDFDMFDSGLGSSSAWVQSTNSLATNGNWPSADDWTRHRPLITRLYVDEDRTLKDVKAIMASQHGHKATAKMYKSRITKWGLDKNNKERDMASILRQKVRRDRLGKASSFRVRGRAVNIDDVYRYFKRRGIAPDSEIWTRFARAGTPSDVSCSTPPPTHSSPSFEVPQPLLPPQELLVPEELFFNIKFYFEASFSSKRWFTNEAGEFVSTTMAGGDKFTLGDFYDYCGTGIQLVINRSYVQARRSLSKACKLVPSILQAQHPRTLEYLLDVYLYLAITKNLAVASLLIGYVSKMSTIFLDGNHPCGQICTLLEKLEPNNLNEAATQAWQCILQLYGQNLGQLHPTTISSHTNFLYFRGIHDPRGTEAIFRELAIKCEESIDKLSWQYRDILLQLANSLYKQGRYSEVESIANDVISRAQEAGETYFEIQGLTGAAEAQYKLLKIELAEETLERAIELGSQMESIIEAMRAMANVESMLRWMGLDERADEVAVIVDGMIEPDEIDEEGQYTS